MTSDRADTANKESTFLEERRSHSEIFVGTALRRSKPTPQTKICRPPLGRSSSSSGGVNLPPANRTLHTHMPLWVGSVIWHWQTGGDALKLGRYAVRLAESKDSLTALSGSWFDCLYSIIMLGTTTDRKPVVSNTNSFSNCHSHFSL